MNKRMRDVKHNFGLINMFFAIRGCQILRVYRLQEKYRVLSKTNESGRIDWFYSPFEKKSIKIWNDSKTNERLEVENKTHCQLKQENKITWGFADE